MGSEGGRGGIPWMNISDNSMAGKGSTLERAHFIFFFLTPNLCWDKKKKQKNKTPQLGLRWTRNIVGVSP